jgi:hypothetical protein
MKVLKKLNKIKKVFILSLILVTPVLWGKDLSEDYPSGKTIRILANVMIDSNENSSNEMKEENPNSNVENDNQNLEEQKKSEVNQDNQIQEEKKVEQVKNVKKTLDGCIQSIESQDRNEQLIALNTCAKDYQKEEKLQNSLMNLLDTAEDKEVLLSTLLLLANQKKDAIAEKMISQIQNKKFEKDPVLSYAAIVVLYSNVTKGTKDKAKEIYQEYSNSEDEILKNLVENLSKKN